MSKFLYTVGLGILLASTAAIATPGAKLSDKTPAEKQYCLKFADDTGSHLARSECRTKKEWRKLGIDVDEISTKDGKSNGAA